MLSVRQNGKRREGVTEMTAKNNERIGQIGLDMENLSRLGDALRRADAVMIGAGAGLSTAAGFVYSGERFSRYFSDFGEKYGFTDMYSGGFYPYDAKEEYWAYWSRYIWVNRYMDAPKPVYDDLFALVKGRDYFVLTTNVDHCFQKAGFDKKRLFYTQGDYGLFQCSKPCCKRTWDNEAVVRDMVLSQGYAIGERNELTVPEGKAPAMRVPTELLPKCPNCGRPLTLNLRANTVQRLNTAFVFFVENMPSVLGTNRSADLAGLHAEGCVLKLLDHHSFAEPS